MAHYTESSFDSLASGHSGYITRVYLLQKPDSTYVRLTDWDTELIVSDNALLEQSDIYANQNVYTPIDSGVNASAVRQESGLKVSNIELEGAISSNLITEDDLHGGVYENSDLIIAWIDARQAWHKPFRISRFTLTDFNWNGQTWTAQSSTVTSKLRRKVGKTYSKTCSHAFMDKGCGVAQQAGTTVFATCQVTAIDTTNQDFRWTKDTTSETKVDDYFKAGMLTWTSGDNSGISYPIYRSQARTGTSGATTDDAKLYLQYPTRTTVQVGDQFTLYAGCDKKFATCTSTSLSGGVNNGARFGGFRFIPGTQQIAKMGDMEV